MSNSPSLLTSFYSSGSGMGASTTPRTVTRAFVDLLQVLAQNMKVDWHGLLRTLTVKPTLARHRACAD